MITINIDQARLDKALAFENAKRAEENPPQPPFTQEEFVEQWVNVIIDRKLSQADATVVVKITEAFAKATDEEKQAVKEVLKLDKAAGEAPAIP
jgi:hypothetical protein